MKKFFGKVFPLAGLCFFLIVVETTAQSLDTFQERREAVLKSLKNAELKERGKHGLPKACARLWNNPKDPVALEYITGILDHPQQSMFDFPGVALALGKFRSSFEPWQIDSLKADLERRCIEQNQFGLAGFLGHGTENHALMMWTSGYLFGQYFPDAKWANGWTSRELMAEMKERIRKTFENVYRRGYTEYLSTTYEVVMNFPVAILLEFAEDPEVKAMSEAYLLYKWSLSSLNNFEGYIIAPYGRMNTEQDFKPDDNVSATSYYNWLLWGWGPSTNDVNLEDFRDRDRAETSYAIYAALSGVVPDDVFFQLANGREVPYVHKSSASTFGHYGATTPHMMMRTVYRDSMYAIGTGNFRWVPGGDYADHDANPFSIVWHSPDRFNFINCTHPYWYSDGEDKGRTPDTWDKGGISPFMQTAHHKNSVIVLFNIPEKDPWIETPSPAKWAWRDGHAGNLIRRGMLRFPKSVDQFEEHEGWIFLREGEVYIGIKPLKEYYVQKDLKGKGLDGFNIIKSDHAQTGFVIEMGSSREFMNFGAFKKQLVQNRIAVSWADMTVAYTSSGNDHLKIRYQPGLPIAAGDTLPEHLVRKGLTGLAESVPDVEINRQPSPHYRNWPLIESPWIHMDNGILKIDNGQKRLTVSWQGKYPKITR